MRLLSLKTVGGASLLLGVSLAVLLGANWPKRQFRDGSEHLSFTISSIARDCGSTYGSVQGLRNSMTIFDWLALQLGQIKQLSQETSKIYYISSYLIDEVVIKARQKYRRSIDSWQGDTAHMTFSLPRGKAAAIQDISFELTDAFHENAVYELSCKSQIDGSDIVFRKMGPQYKNPSHIQPPVNLLPRDCLGQEGRVTVRLGGEGDKGWLLSELMSSVFRATIWDKTESNPYRANLDMYMPRMGYKTGEEMAFHMHGLDTATPASLELIRVGEDAKTWKKVEGIKIAPQKITPYSYRDGLGWPVTLTLEIPADAPQGYQVAVLRQDDKAAMYPFIIGPKTPEAGAFAVIASTNTWQSYNNWGEGSHYESQIGVNCLNTDYARIISTQRPVSYGDLLAETPFGDHLFMAEKSLAGWLDRNKIAYAVYTDDDLHENPKLLEGYKTVLLTPHPEYFTTEMFDRLEAHVKRGGNILNLGGNALYYRVTRQGPLMEKHENGRLHDLDKQFGGTWSGYLGRSPAALLGVEFDARDFSTFAGYEAIGAQHVAFKGTGLKNGEVFAPNASGHEMDRLSPASPTSTILLAEGKNPKGYGAHMVLVKHPSGGQVFSAGSISFYYALARDEKLGTVVKNVINLMEPQ